MTDAPAPKPARTSIWLRIAFVASLALNLLVLGAILGAVLGRDRGPVERLRAARDIAPPPFILALEPETRRTLVEDYRRARPDRTHPRELRARLSALLNALRSEEFDSEAVASLLADQRGQALARQEAGAEVFIRHLAQMSADDRRAYADRLERALKRAVRR